MIVEDRATSLCEAKFVVWSEVRCMNHEMNEKEVRCVQRSLCEAFVMRGTTV